MNITGDPRPYLTCHFEALRTFYEQAAEGRLTVVLWWD
ncbi:YfbM family protein [Streptomyces sp. NBC_00464]